MESKEYDIMYEVEDTHFWYRGMRDITTSLLAKYLPSKTQNTILDAGCGTGAGIEFLKQFGTVHGFDISPRAVEFCHKRGLDNVIEGSIDEIPYDDSKFDLVTCFDVLGQREVSSDQKAIKEFHRVLKPGGILLIRIAANNWLYGYHDVAVHTRHRYNATELEHLFESNKLKTLGTTYANYFFFPPIAAMRLLKRFFPAPSHVESDVNTVHPLVNTFSYYPFLLESKIVRYSRLPFGLSIIGVAQKKL
ncbi:class I SAM-dependent methyltransferase [soil metagenome]